MYSVLTSIKIMLGIAEDYTIFDQELILHINSVFMTLRQLGIGPVNGFAITGANDLWVTFVGNRLDIEAIKTYTYLRVRLIFDPPDTANAVNAFQSQIDKLEWSLNVAVDHEVLL